MVREIIVDWLGPGAATKVSVFFFDGTGTVATQRAALGAMLGSIDNFLSSTTSWTVRVAGRELDTPSGALTGTWADATAQTGVGSGGSVPVPDAAQMLLRWKTSTITGGRFLQGRTFIPGLTTTNISGGNVQGSTITSVQTAMATFLGATTDFHIWHRPVLGAGGSTAQVTSGTVWPELAVLRRRRG